MKSMLVATTAIVGTILLANSAIAEDFDNSTFETVLYSDRYKFSFSGNSNNGFDSVSAGMSFLPYTLGENYNANLYTEIEYHFLDDEVTVTGEYQMYREFNFGELYGAAVVEYVAMEDDFSNGDWYFSPYTGVVYDMSNNVSSFAEVGYSWNMSDEWNTQGGYGEIGLEFMINDSMKVTPSVVKDFDSQNDDAQMNLSFSLKF